MSDYDLGSFDGKDVLRTTIAVTNAGDGLSEALKVDPQLLHLDDKVYVVLECDVAKVQFVPIKDTDALSRLHVLRAGAATLVDADLVRKQLDEQAERIARAKEAASGITRLPYDEELHAAHEAGEHGDALVPGCADCELDAEQLGVDMPGPLDQPVSLADARAAREAAAEGQA